MIDGTYLNGSQFVRTAEQMQKAAVWGDLIHVAAVQTPKPAVTSAFDVDPEQVSATRKKTFTEAGQAILVLMRRIVTESLSARYTKPEVVLARRPRFRTFHTI